MVESEAPDGPRVVPHFYSPGGEIPTITEGDGVAVFDEAGNRYLDFVSQLYCVNAGHGNRAIVDAIVEQLGRIQYVTSSKHNDVRSALAAKLVRVAPDPLSDVYFAVSGSEANEAAIQIARQFTGASKVLTRWRSYHGATYGAGGLSGDPGIRSAFEPYAATSGTVRFLPPMAYRSPFAADTEQELADRAAAHLEFVIRNEGPDSVAALVMEPVAGTSGAYTLPGDYLRQVRELCTEYDVLLVADEVLAGFGRCGDWFSVQTEGVDPDMLTFAKAVTGAYVPLAGTMVRPDIAEHLHETGFPGGQTFGGHPVACAAGVAAIDEYADGIIENVRSLAPTLEGLLRDVAAAHPAVGDVRGRGFLWAVEFTDPGTGAPFHDPRTDEGDGDNPVLDVIDEARRRGAFFGPGRPPIQLLVAPPLVATADELREGIDVLDESITAVFG